MSRGGALGQERAPMTTARIANGLRRREWEKYDGIHGYLSAAGIPHDFEVPVGDFVYDLALPREKLLIEFDGRYHKSYAQRKADKKKDEEARKRGWRVVRVDVDAGKPIPPTALGIVGLTKNA